MCVSVGMNGECGMMRYRKEKTKVKSQDVEKFF